MPNFLIKKTVKRRAWKTINVISTLAIVLNTGMIGFLVQPQTANAATSLTTTILSWNTIGLDSNDPVSHLPKKFLVQARVQNTGATTATGVQTTFTFGSGTANAYLSLVSAPIQPLNSITAGTYKDVFYVVNITPAASPDTPSNAAFDTSRPFTIATTSPDAPNSSAGQTLLIEHLNSQSRNHVISSTVTPPNPLVGQPFTIHVVYETASLYEHITPQMTYNPAGVQMESVTTNYSSGNVESDIYAINEGNIVTSDFHFRALGPGNQTLLYTVLDQSGSSFHYNIDENSTITVPVQPVPALDKLVNKATALPGESITYTLNYANTGNVDLTNVVITEAYDSHFTFGSSNPAPSVGNNTWNLGTLAVGATGSISITGTLTGSFPQGTTKVHNVATLDSDQAAPISDFADTNVTTICTLEITKAVNKQSANPGDVLTYTLHYKNAGTATCTGGGVRVDDTVPAGVTYNGTHTQTTGTDYGYGFAKFGNGQTNINPPAGASLISWNAHELTPGEQGEVTWQATVNQVAPCTEKDITNVGKIYADQNVNGLTSNQVTTHISTPCEGSIKVNKKVDANGDGTFEGGNTEANALGFDWGLDAGAVNRDMGTTASGLSVGSHNVTENAVTNYHFVGWYKNNVVAANFSCANPEGTTLPISVNVAASATTEITLCNARDTGRIVFDKVVVGGTALDSDFTFTVDGHDYKDGDAASFPTGSYALTEGAVTGYTLTGASGACSLGQNGVTLNVTTQSGTCTITNTRDIGRLLVKKNVLGPNGEEVVDTHEFTVTLNGGSPKTIAEGTSAQYPGLTTGTYTVAESVDSDYTLDGYDIDTDVNTPGAQITITKGQTTVLTVTNKQKSGKISGYKWEDKNGNGVWNEGEPALDGWSICLNGSENCVVTGTGEWPTGYYEFANLNVGSYNLSEIVQSHWYQTHAPNGPIEIKSNGNISDQNFGNYKKARFAGKKWEDKNGNGIVSTEDGDGRLQGWTIKATKGDQVKTTTTDANGTYAFAFLPADVGTWVISEELPAGWTQTYPASSTYTFEVYSGHEALGDFGNFKNFDLTVCKYVDLNGNGVIDENDPLFTGENGWQMNVNRTSKNTVEGCATFTNLGPGAYNVSETSREGWAQTYPANPSTYVVNGVSGTPQTVNFANFELGRIWGYKMDTLGNKLAGWEICLNGDLVCDTTDENGMYEFTNLTANTYTVAETLKEGWWAVTPLIAGYIVPVVSGSNEQRDFTNFDLVNISGSKFNDLDGNGKWNNEEPGLSGWTIELYKDVDGFTLVDSKVTDGTGSYSFTNLTPGTYRVREVQQGGWTQTTSDPSDITVVSGQNVSEVDFGNYKYGRISGYKFNDLDGDGYWDEGEPVLNGWSICLNGTENCVVTGSGEWADGYYEFTGLSAATYEVYEQGKAGWTQTLPGDEYEVIVTSGTGYGEYQSYNFGNYQYGRITGYKWDTGENKLDGWTICLVKQQNDNLRVLSNDIAIDQQQNCVVTGAGEWSTGYYEFTNLLPGNYMVYEQTQYGWVQVYPNEPSYHTVNVISGTGYGEQNPSYDFVNRKNTFDVSIEKSADLEVVQAGANVTYTLAWSVTGNTPVEVKLFDTLPANTTFVSADNGGFLDGSTVRWNLGTFNPADNGTVHLTVKVNSPLDKGTVITNTGNICGLGEIADGEPFLSDSEDKRRQKCDDDTTTTTVDSKPLLGIEKTANVATVGGNQDVTYTIVWSVAGNSKATNVVVNDPIPANTTYVSMGCGTTTGTCTTSTTGTPVTSAKWELGVRNPGEGGTLTLVVKTAISVPNGSVIPNVADIRSAEVDPIFDEADVRAATAPQLQITKTTTATIVNPGDPISYTVKVKNIGTDTAINAVMTDTLPAGFSFVTTNPVAASIVGQTGTWNLGNMAVGDEKTITYTVNVAPGTTAGTYDNIAKAKADNAPEVSTKVPVQTRVPQVLGETTSPVLEIAKTVSKSTVAPGDVITYTVKVKNSGTGSAINVVLQDILPVGFTFNGTDNSTQSWNLGDIAVGETKTVSYKVKVGSSVPNGSYENLAIAQADNHGKVSATAPVTVKRGRVLAEVVDTGAGLVDYGIAAAGLGLIILGFVLTRRKTGNELA